VNQGRRRAAKFAQKAVCVTVDGIMGNQTLTALLNTGNKLFVDLFLELREQHYRSLSTFPMYGKGWLNRLEAVRKEALSEA